MTTPDIRTERKMLPAAAPDAANSREFRVTASLVDLAQELQNRAKRYR
jgi:hypothetical protein